MPEDNLKEMNEMESAFKPGGMFGEGMEERWRSYGADEEILDWLKQGGYEVRVPEEAKGIFLKNGRAARQNEEVLEELVTKFLMKGSWELVSEEEVTNVLPLHLVQTSAPSGRCLDVCWTLHAHVE